MSARRRSRLLGVWAITLVVLLVLIGALPHLTLLPERAYEIPGRVESTRPAVDLTWLYSIVLIIYVLGMIVIIPRLLRKRLVYALIGLGMLALLIMGLIGLAVAISRPMAADVSVPSGQPTEAAPSAVTPEPEPGVESVTFTPPPRWSGIVAILAIGLLLIAGVVGVIWRLYFWRSAGAEPPLEQLAARAQAALDALYGGDETGPVVLRCYFEMARILDRTRGIRRVESVTPREFAAQLTALGLPAHAVGTLTRLFEEARYGPAVSDGAGAQRAIESLKVIVAACQEAA